MFVDANRTIRLMIIVTLLTLTMILPNAWALDRIEASDTPLQPKAKTVAVLEFHVDNFIEYPKLEITKPILNELLTRYLQQFPKTPNKASHQLSVDEIHGAADVISQYLRKAGLVFHRAYIPPQEILHNSVRIEILASRLSAISVLDNQHYHTKKISEPFVELVQKPILLADIERALARSNSLPGLEVFGYFSAGAKPGDTRINLKVLQEKRWLGKVRLDNEGAESTGDIRLTADLRWISPTGIADILHVGVVQTAQPTNATYGFVQYRVPFYRDKNTMYVGYSNNQFELGEDFADLLLQGESDHYRIGFDQALWQGRRFSWNARLEYSELESQLDSGFDESLDSTIELGRAALLSSLSWVGLRVQFSALFAGIQLSKDGDDGLHELGSRLAWRPFEKHAHSFALNVKAQFSDKALPGPERFSLAGAGAVRALEVGRLSVDDGVVVQLQMDFWHSGRSRGFVFADFAVGEKINSLESVKFHVAGAGIGFSGGITKRLSWSFYGGNLVVAEQDYLEQTTPLDIEGDNRFVGAIQYDLR